MSSNSLTRAVDLVRARGALAQLCVIRDGHVVLDRSFGCDHDALFWVYSVSKPFVALQVHLLTERRLLSLDDPVAAHWPAYARYGKDAITIRHVLTHRAGVPFSTGSLVKDGLAVAHWNRAVRQAERAQPRWPAGQVAAYHTLSFGFILGELVRRATGSGLSERLSADLVTPLGLRDIHLGLPPSQWSRHVPITARDTSGRVRAWHFNRRTVRQAVVPAAGISATARDLAVFYQMLLNGGTLDGVRVLRPETIAEATRDGTEHSPEIDQVLNQPVRYGHGFQLARPGQGSVMGDGIGPRAFGHNGSGICNAWADPDRGLVVAYLTNMTVSVAEGRAHHREVSDAILDACR